MSDVELMVQRSADALTLLLRRFATLAGGLVLVTLLVGVATFATGAWVIGGSGWAIVGTAICVLPLAAAALAWWRLNRTRRDAPQALRDLHVLAQDGHAFATMGVIVDHDTRQPLAMTARNFTGLRGQLQARREQVPALFGAIQTITTVPGLVALSIVGIVLLGGFGTIMLLVGLLS